MRATLFLLALFFSACSGAPALERGQVQTTNGVAQGLTQGGLTGFVGVEYARAERWGMPKAGPQWNGVKIFDTPSNPCPQKGLEDNSEDCLFLNIFRPENTKSGDKLPILFQIHGGGFIAGQGGSAPSGFARQDIMVVTMNYRLGRLGFYDYAGWNKNEPRNFGLLDVIAALDWVRDNATAFGGNADDITIAGHSAGATLVQLLMVTPDAKGMFSKAIARAGYGAFPYPKASNYSAAQLATMRLQSLESLKKQPAKDFINETPHFLLPFIQTPELPRQPIDMFRAGEQTAVPYITGGNSYDGGGILYGAGFTDESFLALFGSDLEDLKMLYADDFAVSQSQAAQRIMGDVRYLSSARETARAMERKVVPAYLYYVDAVVPDQPGTPHGAETSLIWSPKPNPMQAYWLNFIRTGDPNSANLPQWKVQTKDDDNWMVFKPMPEAAVSILDEKLDFMKSNAMRSPYER